MSKARLPQVLTVDEARAIINQPNTKTATGSRDRAMLVVMWRGGLRVGEVAGLRMADLSADRGKLEFVGKGGKSRTVALDDDIRAALDLWLVHRERFVRNGGPLFCRIKGKPGDSRMAGEAGDPLAIRTIQAAFKRYATNALGAERLLPRPGEKKGVGCHTLRHTHGRDLVDAGTNQRVIQERFGHARPDQTALYTQVSESAQAQALEALPPLEADEKPNVSPELAAIAERAGVDPEVAARVMEAVLGSKRNGGE